MTISSPKGYFGIIVFLCLLFIPWFINAQLIYTITDPRDGKDYHVVKIGEQWWMAENLNIGSIISMNTPQQDNDIIEKYCPLNNEDYCTHYGGLYQFDELMQYGNVEFNQGICPSGWHVPSDNEWKTLEVLLGMNVEAADASEWRGVDQGGQLKMTSGWSEPNACASDFVGFSALPAGKRRLEGDYFGENILTEFWCADVFDDTHVWYRSLKNDSCSIFRGIEDKNVGASVRCVKDSPYIFGRGLLTDNRDGQVYRTVLVGNRWWMAENLNYGTLIGTQGEQTNNGMIEKYCYNNEGGYCKENGGLYQWDEMMNYDPGNKKGICPDGWHIPSEDEWKALEYAAGMPEADLDKTGWERGFHEGEFLMQDGGSGFDAQLGGGISDEKKSLWMNEFGFLWAADHFNDEMAWLHVFCADTNTIGHSYYTKKDALSVRCVSDNNEVLTLSVEATESVCAGQEFTLTANVSGGTDAKSIYWISDPPGFNSTESVVQTQADTTTRYQARVIDGVVLEQAAVIVNVKPRPEFDITGEKNICSTSENFQYSVSSNPDYEYSWSQVGGNIISGENQNQVIVAWGENPGTRELNLLVTDMNTGCGAQKSYGVDVLPVPPKPFIRPKGQYLLICPDSGRIYQWYHDDEAIPGANKQFYYAKGNKSGSFRVETGKPEYQCTSFSEPYTFPLKSTGESGDELQAVFIRPNPSGGNIIMEFINDYAGPVNVSVTNSAGSMVRQYTLFKQSQVYETGIDLGGLDEGLFFMIVDYGLNREVHKLTIKH